ncbi:MAG: MATE family efflux transporter [Salaquimonas sp.]|nr:MATE family efflux transporter [Salaquimonas sp.]
MTSTETDGERGVFTQGSTIRHVLVMSATGAVGLVAIFFVDLANLFYISLLGQQELAAAVGYASTVIFFSVTANVGFTIAATAVTARAYGSRDTSAAHKNAAGSLVFTVILNIVLAAIFYPFLGPMLDLLGATGQTRAIALGFMQIVVPSIPLLGLGMCTSGLLRAKGDARRAMYVTLSSGLASAVIDPILIFGLDLGVTGAALSVVIVRFIFVAVGFHGVWVVHSMLEWPDRHWLKRLARPFLGIGVPAVATAIANPVGNAYVTSVIAQFGDDAVAGWAIVGRVIPLAFAAVFSLSGSVGPILSQNYGSGLFERVNTTLRDSLVFCVSYVLVMWALLALVKNVIIIVFGATGAAAELIDFFCLIVAGSFVFTGALFVANAAFNNLGYPMLSTLFNWGRATLGTIPFVYFGIAYGPKGVLAGWGLGAIVFGAAAVVVCFQVLRRLPERAAREGIFAAEMPAVPTAQSPFSSGRAAGVVLGTGHVQKRPPDTR